MAKNSLTTKQRLFVEAYLATGFNGVKAARAAGYKGNDITLAAVAYENLRKPHIKALIDQRIKEMAMSADEALARLSMSARSDLGEFLQLTPNELANHPRSHLLHKVKITTRTIPPKDKDSEPEFEEKVELELYDAQAAQLAILKEQHLRAGEATDITDDASLTDETRAHRVMELLDAARARRDGEINSSG